MAFAVSVEEKLDSFTQATTAITFPDVMTPLLVPLTTSYQLVLVVQTPPIICAGCVGIATVQEEIG